MEISVILGDGRMIDPGKGIPIENIICEKSFPPGRNACAIIPASPSQELEGTDVVIVGSRYVIGSRQYDLESGYGLRAKLTDKFVLIPLLRKAVGKETKVTSKNGLPTNNYWPMITRLWKEGQEEEVQEKVPQKAYDFVSEALDTMSILTNITDTFSFEDEEVEE